MIYNLQRVEMIITRKYPNGFQTLSLTQQDTLNQALAISRQIRNNIYNNPLGDYPELTPSQVAIQEEAIVICS
jgi:hypothetical protein